MVRRLDRPGMIAVLAKVRPPDAIEVVLHHGIVGRAHVDGEQRRGGGSGRRLTQAANDIVADHVHIALVGDAGLISLRRSVARRVVDPIIGQCVVLRAVLRRRR